ncbi:MAG TPA: cupin domain-containing protein [Candidatus Flavonifractor avistercoris]|nr:cupin domain-containing protein [Candidatus Flavonifractor avistercoris]
MKLDFDAMEETAIPRFRDGEKTTYARMFVDGNNRIMRGRLGPGASIGLHPHQGSSEIVYILSGTGKALYDGGEEALAPGGCHYCPEGHAHSLVNDGGEDLIFFAVVPRHGDGG